MSKIVPDYWQWFDEARFGMFIHWGPYAVHGRGEQALNREHLDQRAYAATARRWNPDQYHPDEWAAVAQQAGMKYAVLTTRHHDGYCLWDTEYTDYSSAGQAPQRDFVREFVEAFRAAGLRIGLYYSLIDFRIPAWFQGPAGDPAGWEAMRQYIFDQVAELLSNYGPIDVLWFDGLWPWTSKEFPSKDLIQLARGLQPHILINDRLEWPQFSHYWQLRGHPGVPRAEELGDFGTPEQGIYARAGYLWESCQVSTQRLWGYATGERWRPSDQLLDQLVECASRSGNLLLNVGPRADGRFPPEFAERMTAIGAWLDVHGEAVYGSEGGNVTEFVTYGWQTVKGNDLYLILRFYPGSSMLRLPDLVTRVKRAVFLTGGEELPFEQDGEELLVHGLPEVSPTSLFPVVKLECDGPPQGGVWARERTWGGDPRRYVQWAGTRGSSVWADGRPR